MKLIFIPIVPLGSLNTCMMCDFFFGFHKFLTPPPLSRVSGGPIFGLPPDTRLGGGGLKIIGIQKKLHIILRLPRGAIGIKNKLDQRNECPFGLDLHELALHILPLNPHVKTQVCMSVCSPRRVRRTHTDAHPQTSDTQMSKLLHPTDVGCKKLVNVVVSALAVFKLVVIFCRG